MFSDRYEVSKETEKRIKNTIKSMLEIPELIDKYLQESELPYADEIVSFINEKFLRVRSGGKLNPEGTDSIYFRISSHGYDWHRTIVEFLWNTFKDPKKMPKRIWIGTDLENRGEEIVMFDGSPEDLLNYDLKRFESLMKLVRSGKSQKQKDDIFKNNYPYLDYKIFS